MPLTRYIADAFGVLTVSLVALLILLGVFCICLSFYFHITILRQRDYTHLAYFNGPWLTRTVLVLVSIWWGLCEVSRTTSIKHKLNLFSISTACQKNICKFYLLSNFGFAEPVMFLTLVFLLRASLVKRGNVSLISCIVIFTLPTLAWQVGLNFITRKFYGVNPKYFTDTSSVTDEGVVCTYPLFGTGFLGLFYLLIIMYAIYVGRKLLSLVINRGLKRRVYWLISTIFLVHPFRISLLVVSVFLRPGSLEFEGVVFIAFCALFFSAVVGIFVLVYLPIADSLALKDVMQDVEIPEMPFDDYYHDGASLIANHSRVDAGRSSDASTMPGSISFRTMIRDEPLCSAVEGLEEGNYQIGSSSSSSPPCVAARSMRPLLELPRY